MNNVRRFVVSVAVIVVLALCASFAWAQTTSVYTVRVCSRLPVAAQRITCRACVSQPRMVYDVPSNSCRPFGTRR